MTVAASPNALERASAEPEFQQEEPRRRLWTRDEYYRAAEAGIFGPDEKLELIEGEVIRKVSPQGLPHVKSVQLVAKALGTVFTSNCFVHAQSPMQAREDSEPEPDVAVYPGDLQEYEDHPHASQSLLVVEVSDSTLRMDRSKKARLYALVGAQEYWIVSLPERCLYVHREPGAKGYASVTKLEETESVSPLAAPEASIAVVDLLPKQIAKQEG
jgi:Uma2 family endonuclease